MFRKQILAVVTLMIFNSMLLGGITGKIVGIAVDQNSGEPLIGVNIEILLISF